MKKQKVTLTIKDLPNDNISIEISFEPSIPAKQKITSNAVALALELMEFAAGKAQKAKLQVSNCA